MSNSNKNKQDLLTLNFDNRIFSNTFFIKNEKGELYALDFVNMVHILPLSFEEWISNRSRSLRNELQQNGWFNLVSYSRLRLYSPKINTYAQHNRMLFLSRMQKANGSNVAQLEFFGMNNYLGYDFFINNDLKQDFKQIIEAKFLNGKNLEFAIIKYLNQPNIFKDANFNTISSKQRQGNNGIRKPSAKLNLEIKQQNAIYNVIYSFANQINLIQKNYNNVMGNANVINNSQNESNNYRIHYEIQLGGQLNILSGAFLIYNHITKEYEFGLIFLQNEKIVVRLISLHILSLAFANYWQTTNNFQTQESISKMKIDSKWAVIIQLLKDNRFNTTIAITNKDLVELVAEFTETNTQKLQNGNLWAFQNILDGIATLTSLTLNFNFYPLDYTLPTGQSVNDYLADYITGFYSLNNNKSKFKR